jgi:hypothetical protein
MADDLTLGELKAAMKEFAVDHFKHYVFRGMTQNDINIIIVLGGADLTDLQNKLNAAKTDYVAVRNDTNALANTDILKNFSTGSDAQMKTFIEGHMPNLTNAEQKIAVAVILQRILDLPKKAP